jgi:hypothetical protein
LRKSDPVWTVIKRTLFFGVIFAVLIFFILGFLARCQAIDDPPSVKTARWGLQTDTRYYYAKELRLVGETPELRDYWTFDGKRYHFKKEVKSFPEDLYKVVAIIDRTGKKGK